jgi:oxygen-independent coproporphyrinogen-3 oxidase
MERDGLVHVACDRLEITGLGRLFVRNVCMAFDAYRGADSGPLFSRTV